MAFRLVWMGGLAQGTKLCQGVAHYLQQKLIAKPSPETAGKEDSGTCPVNEG